jgi:hypothetical protein
MLEDIENDDHQVALTTDNKEIHISKAESGKNGYYCKYCGHEMVARKSELRLRRPHFAHDSKQKVFEGKCIYSNETYRHKVAKEILQRLMKIRVPMVVKHPPTGIEGIPYILQSARTIEAHSVSIEMPFYEDENGAIKHGKNVDLSTGTGRNLLIQPDVTFFDIEGRPILFIEIVATHKPDIDKRLKIRKLGVDTVQVSIPKDIEEEIEKTFSHVERTKWLFNYEQEKTEYVHPSEGNGEGIPPFGDFEAKLFKESETFECKKFAVNEFIRRIRKIMASSEFREFEEELLEEIRHVEVNTARYQNEWAALQDRINGEVRAEFAHEEKRIEREEEFFETAKREFEAESRSLEKRYLDKRRELEHTQREYRPGCQSEITRIENDFERLGTGPNEIRERIEKLRIEESKLEQQYLIEAEGIEDSKRRAGEANTEYKRRKEALSSQYSEDEKQLRDEFEEQVRNIEQESSEYEKRITNESAGRNSALIRGVKAGDSKGVSGISKGIRMLLETKQHFSNIRQRERDYARMRKIEEILDSKDYKYWLEL